MSELACVRLHVLHQDLAELANIHGTVFGLPLGEVKSLVIGDAGLAEHILSPRRAGRAFGYRWEDPKHLPFARWGQLLGASTSPSETAGIFFGNGPHHWAPPRRACERGLLHGRSVREAGEKTALAVAGALAERWATGGSRAFDVHPDIREATLDVVMDVAFGGTDYLDAASSRELRDLYSGMTRSLEELAGVSADWWWLLRRGGARTLHDSAERLRALLLPKLKERKGARPEGARRCAVDLLLDADLSEGAVLFNTLQVLGAGHDTTATSLAMLLWHLAEDQPLQQAVRQEVRTERTVAEPGEPSPLLSACVREVLRMWPAAPLIVRQALEPVPPYEGLEIPTGTVAIVAPWLLGRSAQLWAEPQTFRPQRFLDPAGQGDAHPFAWIPFGYGLRSCVGQHLAVAELKAFGAALLRRLRFTAVGPPTVEWFLTLRLRDGLRLHVDVLD